MTLSEASDVNEWLERSRSLASLVDEYRDEGELERHLPQAVFEAIRDAGIFRLPLSTAYGGHQASPATIAEVVEEFSRQDGSVGWNVLITSAGGMFADYLPADGAKEIYGAGDALVVGSFAPLGQASEVAGGYQVSGRWPFASGCHNANWLIGGFLIPDGGKPRLGADGKPDVQLMIMPKSDCQIIDTWRTTGMRGTGSHDFTVSDVFVPESHSFPFSLFNSGPPSGPNAAYSQPFFAMVPPFLAVVALGIARDAIESLKTLAMTKTPRGGLSTLAQQHTVHERLGKAEAMVRSARAYLYETLRQVGSSPMTSLEETTELVASARLAGAYVAQCAVDAVDLMFDAAGGTSIYSDSRLDRCFRDVHTITHHVMVSYSGIEMVGQYLLGQGLQMRR